VGTGGKKDGSFPLTTLRKWRQKEKYISYSPKKSRSRTRKKKALPTVRGGKKGRNEPSYRRVI